MPSSTQMRAARMIFGSSPSGNTTRLGLLHRAVDQPAHDAARAAEPRLEPLAVVVEIDELVARRRVATAAHATAGATQSSTRGSNGNGMR